MSRKSMFANTQPMVDAKIINPPVLDANPIAVMKPEVASKLALARQVNSEMDISEFGTESGKEVAKLADTILQKTTAGKMGDFGEGITQILSLTSQVNLSDLNLDKNKGIVNKLTNLFKKKKAEVLAQFEDTSKSIDSIASNLTLRQNEMRKDNLFLDELYAKNMAEFHNLGFSIDAAEMYLVEMEQTFSQMRAAAEVSKDQMEIQKVNEYEQKIKRWEKQIDRLKRTQQIALLTAPEIRQIQAGNVELVEKFNDVANTTLPAWKKQMSKTIIAARQKDNAALAHAIDERTNEFFRKAAELGNQNAIAIAKTNERSVVDVETLEYMQTQLIDSVRQVSAIQEQGRSDRKAASDKISVLRDQMKQEMLSWSK